MIHMERKVITIGNKNYKHYKDRYYITEYGELASIQFNEQDEVIMFKVLKQETSNFGHKRVEIKINKETRKVLIHRVVYEVWIGELIEGMVIEHLDANPSNNHVSNLKQSTQKENIQTAVMQGRFWGRKTNILVYDKKYNTTKGYECVRDFLVDIGAPDYMVNHGSLTFLNKRKEYKDRFIDEKIGRKGRSQQTIESVGSEKDTVE